MDAGDTAESVTMLELITKSNQAGYLLAVTWHFTQAEVQRQLDEMTAMVQNGQMAIERKKSFKAALG